MSMYHLTEAYTQIYDPRKVEDLFDNLRFVDYMQDEDIQSVIEELVWEYRDYGHTLDEAFNIIDYALEDSVICEAYDQLAYDILSEATVTQGRGRAQVTSSSSRSSAPGSGSSRITLGRGGSVSPSGSANVTANRSFDKGEVQRRAARIGRIRTAKNAVKTLTGPIRSVKQSVSGAAGGIGRAAKTLGGQAVEKGKALLKGLLRRGGKAATNIGRSMEKRGEQAASSGLATRQAGRATRGGQMELVYTPSTQEKAGKTGSRIGRAIRKVGVAMRKMGKEDKKEPKLTRSEYDQRKAERDAAARSSVGNAFTNTTRPQGPKAPPAQGPRRPYAETPKPTKPTKRFGKSRFKSPEAEAKYKEMMASIKEDQELLTQYIAEDIVNSGYANDLYEAFDIIESLNDDQLAEIIAEYL